MPPPNQPLTTIQNMLSALMERMDKRVDGLDRRMDVLESRLVKVEEEIDTKYLQLLEKIDSLKNWLIGLIIGSIIIPSVFVIVTYYLNHPK